MAETEILFLTKDHWEIVLKVVGPIAGAVLAYFQRQLFARPRATLKADLELLKLLEGTDLDEQRETLQREVLEGSSGDTILN